MDPFKAGFRKYREEIPEKPKTSSGTKIHLQLLDQCTNQKQCLATCLPMEKSNITYCNAAGRLGCNSKLYESSFQRLPAEHVFWLRKICFHLGINKAIKYFCR